MIHQIAVAVIVVPHTITPSLRQLVASRLFRQDLLHLQDQTNLAPGQIVKLAEQEDVRWIVADVVWDDYC